ncbi:jg19610 [Pararge aegeria aegeria]|uniref:Jg19610 protein n=1 Tax=Pararge aegeria aegeria TaxID=348720 RepID=A0A8S4SH02_9NEOP|nr:jg19610 [Pararge aegeria aegeria]
MAGMPKQTPFHFSYNRTLFRACMKADETPTHVLLRCRGVAEQRAAYRSSLASLPEAIGDLGGLLSFWSELGWLERPSGELYRWHYVLCAEHEWRQMKHRLTYCSDVK